MSKSKKRPCPNCKEVQDIDHDCMTNTIRCKSCGKTVIFEDCAEVSGAIELAEGDDDGWMETAGVSPEDAFRKAVQKALADGIVTASEREVLLLLRRNVGLDSFTAKRIFDEEKTAAVGTEPESLNQVDITKTAKLLQLAAKASETGNHEESLLFCNKALEEDPQNYQAWFLKGKSVGWLSSVARLRLEEMQSAFAHAVRFAPPEKAMELMKAEMSVVAEVSWATFQASHRHMIQYSSLHSSWPDFIERASKALEGLDYGLVLVQEPRVAKNAVEVCSILIRGIHFRDTRGNTGTQFISPIYEEGLREKMNKYRDIIRQSDPTYELPQVSKVESGCFVVTAVAGNADDPRVQFLRRFRDEWLFQKHIGPRLIDNYRRIGPIVADIIRDRWFLRGLVNLIVVQPVLVFARIVLKERTAMESTCRNVNDNLTESVRIKHL